jgi:hypothetical protein
MTQEPASLRRIIKKAQKVDFLSSEGFLMTETAKALNIDTAVFKDFGDVVEVKTTED